MKSIKSFDSMEYFEIWSEFNILEVLLALLQPNYSTGTDIACQCDLLTICVNLLTGTS